MYIALKPIIKQSALLCAVVLAFLTHAPLSAQTLNLPPRPPDSLTGSSFIRSILGLTRDEREDAIYREIAKGNIPSFLRSLQPVLLLTSDDTGNVRAFNVLVTPDYIAVGDDKDFVRMPMGAITAQKIADLSRMRLPNADLVDAIYRQAAVKLNPLPLPPGPLMRSSLYYAFHNLKIQQQSRGVDFSKITAGHKKDIVLDEQLIQRSLRLAIYGWHKLDAIPIQGLSLFHGIKYVDYSHGLRLVSAEGLAVPSRTYDESCQK